jgi:hypothetical protein
MQKASMQKAEKLAEHRKMEECRPRRGRPVSASSSA